MTNAYRGANHHQEMAAKYTKLGDLEQMLYAINSESHWVVGIKIQGHNADFVSGRDSAFDAVIKSALEKLIAGQHRAIAEHLTRSEGGKP